MLKFEIMIESDTPKVELNNLLLYVLSEMEQTGQIAKFSMMVTAVEEL